jgi:hypothetical protein
MTVWSTHELVEHDLDTVAAHYERELPGLGARFLDAYEATLRMLHASPHMGTRVRVGRFIVRRVMLDVFPYAVVFAEVPDGFLLLTVIHGRRHPRHWRQRLRSPKPST